MALPQPPPVRCGPLRSVAGFIGFTIAVTLSALPIGHTVRVVGWLHRLVRRPARSEEALVAVVAARRAGAWFPGRAACLENSLAAVFTAALLGCRVDWCVGARMMPYAAHAWIEAAGRPVGEPAAPDRPHLLIMRV
ncbi:lasso peptide biosynthesis B2 protein [Nocardiopsis changdeensis]|uniref:Lasso peptide biosynthesis B2 protein n=1 Tax=Nocardiopsis changdeensis TaxID=2831969 RepID=A0ABX8BNN6_9ACTN|nr:MULTISPECIES: lasso peptide biosynthesis B2 protein [Nocardiopsis]QUX23253.1 lasso peptide biosynthesis B2 protein [Nocardiopsis changdeensis]QYX39195.1 lasso peptide biosynthesis B2 protein [Nocardiopsis sp. MT53]